MQELLHTEQYEGFTINLYALEESNNPRDSFDLPEPDMVKLLDDIERGLLVWFCAKVTASIQGVELASDYLGGCCYDSYSEFINLGCYYGDMRETVVIEAKAKIKEICKGAN